MLKDLVNVKGFRIDGGVRSKRWVVWDPEAEKLIWGQPGLFRNNISEKDALYSAHEAGIKSIELVCKEGVVFDDYCIEVKHAPLPGTGEKVTHFWVDRKPGERFVKVVAGHINRKRQVAENIKLVLVRHFKSAEKVDLKAFSETHIDLIRDIVFDPESISGPEDALQVIYGVLDGALSVDFISGFVDRERHVYVDKHAAAKNHKHVNVSLTMDFDELASLLGAQGVTVSNISCPQCKAPVSVPKMGSVTECASCGSSLHVSDVYEKFKALLG